MKSFPKSYIIISILLIGLITSGCRKKHHPNKTVEPAPTVTVKKADSLSTKKVIKPKKKDIIPDVITIDDKVARKSIDGRLFYDLLGNRYWKNYKDGKYYLFNQSMYSNDDFKPK